MAPVMSSVTVACTVRSPSARLRQLVEQPQDGLLVALAFLALGEHCALALDHLPLDAADTLPREQCQHQRDDRSECRSSEDRRLCLRISDGAGDAGERADSG